MTLDANHLKLQRPISFTGQSNARNSLGISLRSFQRISQRDSLFRFMGRNLIFLAVNLASDRTQKVVIQVQICASAGESVVEDDSKIAIHSGFEEVPDWELRQHVIKRPFLCPKRADTQALFEFRESTVTNNEASSWELWYCVGDKDSPKNEDNPKNKEDIILYCCVL